MSPRQRLLAAAALGLAVWSRSVPAHADDEPGDQGAVFEVLVNMVDKGTTFIVLRQSGDVLIERKDLEEAGLSHFTATDVKAQGRVFVSLYSVRPRMKFEADEDAIALKLTAPIEMLPEKTIDLATGDTKVSYDNRASAFLNYSPTLSLATGVQAQASAFLEGGISENHRLWYSAFSAATNAPPTRQLTNLTVDNVPKLVHTIVGDANVSTGALGTSAVLAGLTYARDFTLNPYFVRSPSMRFASATDVPAEVDVYVNGLRVKTQTINPGTFTLDNLRGLTGGGVVQYVLRDSLGGVQSFAMPYYIAPTVLKKGLDDFALSAGLPRDNVTTASFDYELPAAIGYYRRGITDDLTLGVRGEAQWGALLSGGPDIAATTSFGTFELDLAASAAPASGASGWQPGAAGVLSYSYLSRRFGASASLRVLTSQYAYLQLTTADDRALYQATASISTPVTVKWSLVSQFSVDANRDIPTSATAGIISSVLLSQSLSLVTQASFGTTSAPAPEFTGLLGLLWAPDTYTHASLGAVVTANVPAVNLQYGKSTGYGEDWGLNAAANVGQTSSGESSTEVSVNHRLQTSWNTLSTYFDWLGDSGSLSFNPAGSIVWVAGVRRVFFARPISDAFALVRIPGIKGIRVYLNSQVAGRTDDRGDVIVPSLVSYYGSRIKIGSQDVPLNYLLEDDALTVAPPRRGAGFAEFKGYFIHYFRGRVLVIRGGKEEKPAYGDLAVKNRGLDNISPLAEDGAFEIEGLSPGPHDAEVRYTNGICKFRLEAKASDAPMIDLGVLHCTMK